MAKARFILSLAACLAAGLVAACDNETKEPAQENAVLAPDSESIELTGILDRSFVGEDVPDITVIDPDGEIMALSEVGEPMLLNLWATWCAPCVVEMPLLDELAGEMDGRLKVVTVSEDLRGAEVVVPFFEQDELPNLPRWLDTENDLAFSFGGGPVLPLTVMYDAQGKELWRVIGAYDWAGEDARAAIEEALADSEATENAVPAKI